jgi:hypothetical protein|tara:strand:- start:723 stop:1370 length:648 start_codon:yes stop_codon:yes gene_type:complete
MERSMKNINTIKRTILASLFFLVTANATAESLDYEVIRKGKNIGTHSFAFESSTEGSTVKVKTDIAVKIAFVTVYKFQHEATEVWEESSLLGYNSTTNDNGDQKFLKLNEGFVTSNKGEFDRSSIALFPASLWSQGTVSLSSLMNTLDGSMMDVNAKDLGEELVKTTSGKTLTARHFSLKGGLDRELWYDADGRLVHVEFLGGDGSIIMYKLKDA